MICFGGSWFRLGVVCFLACIEAGIVTRREEVTLLVMELSVSLPEVVEWLCRAGVPSRVVDVRELVAVLSAEPVPCTAEVLARCWITESRRPGAS